MVLNIVVNFLWGYVNLGEGENMVKMGVFGHILRYFEGFWGYFAEQLTWGLVFEGILGSNLGSNLGWVSIWGAICANLVILSFWSFWAPGPILGFSGPPRFWGFLGYFGGIWVLGVFGGFGVYCEYGGFHGIWAFWVL